MLLDVHNPLNVHYQHRLRIKQTEIKSKNKVGIKEYTFLCVCVCVIKLVMQSTYLLSSKVFWLLSCSLLCCYSNETVMNVNSFFIFLNDYFMYLMHFRGQQLSSVTFISLWNILELSCGIWPCIWRVKVSYMVVQKQFIIPQ